MEKETLGEGYLHSDDTPVVAILERRGADARGPTGKRKKARVVARLLVYVALSGKMFFRFTR